MTDPVNVRIARFVGWTDVQKLEGREKWVGIPPKPCHVCGKPSSCIGCYEQPERAAEYACDECCGHGNEDGWCLPIAVRYEPIPDFEHDWAATGPLIERFRISIGHGLIGDRWRSSAEILGVQGLFSLRWSDQGEADILPAVARVLLALADREQEKRA